MGSSSKRSAKQSARAPEPAAAQSHACATPPKKTGPRAAPFALRAVFEQLEPRLLLSADLNPLATEALLATPAPASGSEFRALTDPGHPSAVTAAAVAPVQRTHELVFIDPRVPDRDQLLAGLTGQSTDGRRFEVIVLDTTRDGIAQVTAALAERIQIDAVHFISHGTDGAVQLGRTWLDAKTLAANADAVASWGESLKRDADLLFYGCDLAASARGRALVEWIAELTRGDVAASTGVTGSAALGGDWNLEYRRGQIETPLAPSAAGLSVWQGTLAQTFYLGGDTTPPFSGLETAAPTDAIWDGNNNYDPGRDAEPGLLIKKDNASASQSDTEKHHTWTALAPAGGIVIANEQVTLSVWSAMKDNDPDKEGTITAYLLDMASATATSGTQIAQATVPLKPWSANFAEEVLDFGIVNHTVAAGRYLGVKLVVGNESDDDLWFAYDATAYRSRLEIGASNAPPVIPPAIFNVQENAANGTAIGTVVASDPDPEASFSKIYWTDLTTNEIRRANLDGSGSEVLVAGLQDPTALAVDHLGGKIYWADAGSDRIQRADLDGTNVENLVTTGLSNVVSLKLDLAAGKMYWVDSSARTIQRANLDGSTVQTLLNAAGGVETPTGLDLDVAGGTLYWMENNGSTWSGQIRRANLDGSGATTLITGLRDPWSLSLHVAGGKMYWNDLKADAIARANLDGTGLELILSSVPNVGEVIVDAARSRLLFTDQQNDRVSRSNLDGSGVQTVVGTGASPAGLDLGPAGPLLTYSITAGNIGGAFAINPVTGAITVANGGALDFETTPSFALTVRVQDAGGSAAAATVMVNVVNVNEAPVHSVPGAQSTPEDTALVFAGPLAFSLADPDLGAGLAQVSLAATNGTLTLGGTVGLSFSVGDGAADATMTFTGTLAAVNTALAGMSFLPTPNFTGAAGITIVTNDQGGSGAGGGQIGTDSVAISVIPMNDAPVAIAASASGNEDEAQIAITLTAADLEGPVASFRLNGLPANGLLYADAGLTTLAAIATDYAAAGNALTLYFVPAADWNGTTSFQFTAVDGGGLADATPGNATINVTPLNDAPAGTDGAVATLMNTPRVLAAADFGFTDVDSPDTMSAVRIESLPLPGTLSVGGIPLLLPGAVVTAAQLAGGDLVFTPLLLTSGTPYASFDFSVADAASVFDPMRNVLTINVLFVNSPPDGTNTSVTTNEDTPYVLAVANFGFTDPDAGDSLGAARIDVLPTAGVLTLLGTPVTPGQVVLAADIAAGRLVFTPAPDASGVTYASFTFSVRDSNGAFDTTANLLTLTVSPVNDPPVAGDNAYAVSEDATLSVPLASAAVLANDTDVDGPALSAALVAGPANGVLALAPNGTFTYTPNANFYGTDTFTYRAFDGSASSNAATVTITVNNVVDHTLVVDTAADTVNGDTTSIDALLANKGIDGLVSLREAILAANATANAGTPDLIRFSIAGSGPHTIALAATLPQVTDAVLIDGTTEPDFAGAPVIVLDGNGGAGNGLRLAANGSTVRGLAIVDFGQAGILVTGTGNTIEGNYIGIAADGVTAAGNQTYGVRVNAGGNVIGGTTAAQRNVISGNQIDGLYIAGGSGNVVQGNYVGTNAAGTAAVANLEDGIWIDGGSNTIVGGTALGEGNLLSGNAWSGIALSGSSAGTVILGNRIGLDAAGTGAIANQRHGVDLGSFSGATVGGTAAGAANVIAFNRIEGVSVAAGTGHSILGNSIFANGGLGIDLTSGANSDMNAPVIYSVTVSGGTVTIAGEARPGATVEFFEADPDPSGRGEGRTLLGSGVVSGAVAGAVDPTARRFTFTFAAGSIAVGDRLTATATDGGGSTSEFAVNVVANALPPGIAITPIGGLVTTEDGGIAEFLVVLESEPAADVTIAFSTSDATEGTVAPASLTFTALNWSVAQIVTVTGVADFLTDGTVAYSLVAAAVTSADPGYSGLDPADIALTNVDGVNEAPVNSVPGAQSTAEDSALVFTGPLAFSIADSDLGAGFAEITLAGTNGTLTLGGTAGLAFSAGDGTDDVGMTFTGTIAAVNAALAGMTFLPTLNFSGTAGITITTSDQGASGSGGTRTDTDSVTIGVTPVNDAPTLANPIPNQNATEDAAFNFQFAANTFADLDLGATLTYSAQLAGGGALPAWLTFDAATRTFSGTPANADVGTVSIDVIADDGNGGTVTDTFDIVVANTNDAPTVANPIPNQNATEDAAFNFQFAANTFADLDLGATLTYSAQLAGGGALPAWLTFDAATRTFSGTPANPDVGTVSIDVIADDGNGGTVTDTFDIVVANTNDAPTVANPIPNQNATEDAAFNFQFAANTFADLDLGATLTYSAQLAGGGALPAWLTFDAATRTFSGTPANADVGTVSIDVIADDGNGGTVTDTFDIVVANTNDAPTVANPIPNQNATEDAAFNFQFAANTFADLDLGATLTYSAQLAGGGALPAWLTFDAATRTFSGTPANADVGTVSIDVIADDGNGGTVTDTFDIVVANTNDAPTTTPVTLAAIAEDSGARLITQAELLANASDIEGDTLTVTGVGGTLNGTVSLAAGTITFTPAANYYGPASFTYTIDDGNGGTVTATVNVTITAVNDAPTAADSNVAVAAAYAFSVADFNYSDVDGDPLDRIRITALPVEGQLLFDGVAATLNQEVTAGEISAGRLTYVPPTTSGAVAASFGFSVSDGTLYETASHTMTIGFASGAVTPPPPPPAPPTITPPPTPPADPAAEPPAAGEPAAPGGSATSGGGRGGGGGGGEGAAPPAPPAPEGAAAPAESAQAAAGVVASAAPPVGSAPAGTIGFQSSGVAANPGVAAPALPADQRGEPPVGEVKAEMEAVAAMAAPEVRRALDEMRERAQEDVKVEARVAGSVFVVSTGLSVGYVLWLLRGGALIASLLSSLPAWRLVDPLPVLGSMGGRAGDEDDDSLEDLVADNGPPGAPGEDALADNDNVGSVRT